MPDGLRRSPWGILPELPGKQRHGPWYLAHDVWKALDEVDAGATESVPEVAPEPGAAALAGLDEGQEGITAVTLLSRAGAV